MQTHCFFIYLQVLAGLKTHACRTPLSQVGCNCPPWDVLLQLCRHHTRLLLWRRFSKHVKKGLVSRLCSSENSPWCTLCLPALLLPLLFYFILIIPLFSLLSSLILLMRSLQKTGWDCQLVEISSVWGRANSLQLRHTAIQLSPFHLYNEKLSTISYCTSLKHTNTYMFVYIYTHTECTQYIKATI